MPIPTLSHRRRCPRAAEPIRGIGEKFSGEPGNRCRRLPSIPVFTSPGRGGFHPELTLQYDSGQGNGPFGVGWSLSLPRITRKTDKGLPRYIDGAPAADSDTFVLSGRRGSRCRC